MVNSGILVGYFLGVLGSALDPVRALLSPPIPTIPPVTFLTGRAGRIFPLPQDTKIFPKLMSWCITIIKAPLDNLEGHKTKPNYAERHA